MKLTSTFVLLALLAIRSVSAAPTPFRTTETIDARDLDLEVNDIQARYLPHLTILLPRDFEELDARGGPATPSTPSTPATPVKPVAHAHVPSTPGPYAPGSTPKTASVQGQSTHHASIVGGSLHNQPSTPHLGQGLGLGHKEIRRLIHQEERHELHHLELQNKKLMREVHRDRNLLTHMKTPPATPSTPSKTLTKKERKTLQNVLKEAKSDAKKKRKDDKKRLKQEANAKKIAESKHQKDLRDTQHKDKVEKKRTDRLQQRIDKLDKKRTDLLQKLPEGKGKTTTPSTAKDKVDKKRPDLPQQPRDKSVLQKLPEGKGKTTTPSTAKDKVDKKRPDLPQQPMDKPVLQKLPEGKGKTTTSSTAKTPIPPASVVPASVVHPAVPASGLTPPSTPLTATATAQGNTLPGQSQGSSPPPSQFSDSRFPSSQRHGYGGYGYGHGHGHHHGHGHGYGRGYGRGYGYGHGYGHGHEQFSGY